MNLSIIAIMGRLQVFRRLTIFKDSKNVVVMCAFVCFQCKFWISSRYAYLESRPPIYNLMLVLVYTLIHYHCNLDEQRIRNAGSIFWAHFSVTQ